MHKARAPEHFPSVFVSMNAFNACMNVVLNALISKIDLPTYERVCVCVCMLETAGGAEVAQNDHYVYIPHLCTLEYLSSAGDLT